MVPSPLAPNPFGRFVLFLATGRNKLYLYLDNTTSFKTESFHSFRNVLLSAVKKCRPGLLVQFTGFFLIHPGIPSIRLFFDQAHFWKPC